MGKVIFRAAGVALTICFAAAASVAAGSATKTIVFLGDSLAAGAGVRPEQAFPALIGDKIRAARLPFVIENAGVSGDTTAGGLRRLDWLLQRKIDVLVVELGANDGLRGLPLKSLRENLEAIIDKMRAKNPQAKIVIAGMQIPPNVGGEYARDFQRVFEDVAREKKAILIPFLLQGVGGHRDMNQTDAIHPTAEGHRRIAETVWRILEPILQQTTVE